MRLALFVTALAAGLTAAAEKGEKPKDGQSELQGTWTIVDMEKGKAGEQPVTAQTVVFEGAVYAIKAGTELVEQGTFKADASKTPHRIEVASEMGKDKGKKWHGVYEVKGNTLRALVGPADQDAPAKLGAPKTGQRAFTLKRTGAPKP